MLTGDPTGFPNQTDSVLTFTDSSPDRTFVISPAVDDFTFYHKGVEFTKDAGDVADCTVQAPNVSGLYAIYFDSDGILYIDDVPGSIGSREYILDKCPVAFGYWDAVDSQWIYTADERHTPRLPRMAHYILHDINGGSIIPAHHGGGDAFEPSVATEESGDDDFHAQVGFGDGEFFDEDLFYDISDTASTAEIPIFYRSGVGGAWRRTITTISGVNFPLKVGATPRLQYNLDTAGTWTTPEVTNGQFGFVHFFISNDINYPIIGILGQEDYVTIASAQAAATTELNRMLVDGLPMVEMAPICTIAFQSAIAYLNKVNCRTREVATGIDWVDYRPKLAFTN